MLSIRHFASVLLLFFFLLQGAKLTANNATKIENLETERKQLRSDTMKIRSQIRTDRKRVLKLKRKIVNLLKQNNMLTLKIDKEMKRYDKQTTTALNNESKALRPVK